MNYDILWNEHTLKSDLAGRGWTFINLPSSSLSLWSITGCMHCVVSWRVSGCSFSPNLPVLNRKASWSIYQPSPTCSCSGLDTYWLFWNCQNTFFSWRHCMNWKQKPFFVLIFQGKSSAAMCNERQHVNSFSFQPNTTSETSFPEELVCQWNCLKHCRGELSKILNQLLCSRSFQTGGRTTPGAHTQPSHRRVGFDSHVKQIVMVTILRK